MTNRKYKKVYEQFGVVLNLCYKEEEFGPTPKHSRKYLCHYPFM